MQPSKRPAGPDRGNEKQPHDHAQPVPPHSVTDTAPDGIATEERQRSDAAREHGGLAETDSRREKHRKPS